MKEDQAKESVRRSEQRDFGHRITASQDPHANMKS